MAWLRITDAFGTHPIVLGVMEHPDADERSVDEVAGYIVRLSTQAALHFTDYVITFSTAAQFAGSKERAERLLLQADYAGYGVFEEDEETGRRRFRLVDDPEFIHMITAEEKAWQDQRKSDNGNPQITVPARLRDGDVCRYCYNVVNFGARKGKLRGTYDHRPPGEPSSWETTVVCCGECNQVRGKKPVPVADVDRPLRPVLPEPYYHASTREWLQGYEQILRQHGMVPPEPAPDQKNLISGRPVPGAPAAPKGRRATGTTSRPAAAGAAPIGPASSSATAAAGRQRPTARRVTAPGAPTVPAPVPADSGRSRQKPGLQHLDLPGRDGTGRDGSPLLSPRPAEGQGEVRRRKRRGKRGGRRSKTETTPVPVTDVQLEDPPDWALEELGEAS